MICRFNTNFPLSFLEWKLNRNINENCYSLNFDYYDAEMSILQKSITPDSNGKLKTDLSHFYTFTCFTVFFGGKYLKRISDILKQLTSKIGKLPLAIFLVTEAFNKNQDFEIRNSFDGQTSIATMVVYINLKNN